MERIVVTGVNGFVGEHLVNASIERGFEVVGVGREETSTDQLQGKLAEYVQCDMTDYDAVSRISLEHVRGIINLAGLAAVGPSFDNPDLYMHVNTAVLDTVCKSVAEHAPSQKLRILAISSGAVYSSDQEMPLTERSKLDPDSSPYAKSKIAMEGLAAKYREQGLDCVVARPFNHIGPGQAPGFLLPDLYKKAMAALADKSVIKVGNITTRRDYTDVRDVCAAYVDIIAADKPLAPIYNICSGRSLSGEEILQQLLAAMDAEGLQTEVDQTLFRPSDAPDLYGDNTLLRTDTGWQPHYTTEETVTDFVVWARA